MPKKPKLQEQMSILSFPLNAETSSVKTRKLRRKVMRFDENPFIENMVIPKKETKIKLSRLGRDDNILVNQATGEVRGTHVTSFKTVDKAKFVKLFVENITLTFDLTAAGVKSLNVLIWEVHRKAMNKDEVALDSVTLNKFVKDKKMKLSHTTFKRGLTELVENQIIARTRRQGEFFINPNFVFNGDRIVFSNAIECEKEIEEDPTITHYVHANENPDENKT